MNELEGYPSSMKNYYLNTDCHLNKEISLCYPDDRKSFTSLSIDICSKYPVVLVTGVEEDYKCCYITRVSVDKQIYIYNLYEIIFSFT